MSSGEKDTGVSGIGKWHFETPGAKIAGRFDGEIENVRVRKRFEGLEVRVRLVGLSVYAQCASNAAVSFSAICSG